MAIHWYPGHMHKAQKEIKAIMPSVDLLIEVIDARIPFSSENPMIAKLRRDKPCIKVLSKSDLADPAITARWQAYLEREKNVKTVAITTADPANTRKLIDQCRKLFPNRDKAYSTIKTLIVGIPNVGKSTLINTLAGRTIAKTGNEPAITKAQQRINLDDGIVLFDTPGILWPKVENINSGYRLAASGAIRDTAMEYDDVAFYILPYLLSSYPEELKARFNLDQLPPAALEFLEEVGAKRGCLKSGGRVNLNQVSKLFINELRTGQLGRISLETPEMIELELIQLEEEKAAKEEADKLRKSNFNSRNSSREPQVDAAVSASDSTNNANSTPRKAAEKPATATTKAKTAPNTARGSVSNNTSSNASKANAGKASAPKAKTSNSKVAKAKAKPSLPKKPKR